MKFFKLQTNLMSYTYPIIKIVICVCILLLMFFREKIFSFENRFVSVVLNFLCIALVCLSIFCIYISIFEIYYVHKNTGTTTTSTITSENTSVISIDKICEIMDENAIIEIEVLFQDTKISIGSSSDCKNHSSNFYNKKLYIGEKEYDSIECFKEDLLDFSFENNLYVISIDGISTKYYNLP